jgi:hypothetical protein
MRNILNVITDVLTLIAVSVAAIGLVGFSSIVNSMGFHQGVDNIWFSRVRSLADANILGAGISLSLLGVGIMVSLVAPLPLLWRRFLTLGMFATAFTAMLFLVFMITTFDRIQFPDNFFNRWDAKNMLIVAIVPTGFAIFFSLIRMIWTMPPERRATEAASAGPSRAGHFAAPVLHAAAPPPFAGPVSPPPAPPDLPLERIADGPPAAQQGIRGDL